MRGKESGNYQPSKIAFNRKAKSTPATSMLQLGIAAALGLMVLGWLQFGNDIFYYLLWVIVPLYIIYRLKGIVRRK